MNNENKIFIKWSIIVTLVTIGLLLIVSSIYTVDEGNVGIIKRWGQAVKQVDPGLHFKIPIADEVVEIEVRTRKNVEHMPVATSEQMPAEAVISVNWTVNKASVLELYKKYGSLDQFENRILDPKLREASKSGISKFTAEENINKRDQVTNRISGIFLKEISGYPVTINSMQYENLKLPKNYIESISRKQTAKNERDAEKFRLEKQALEAQRAVNTANAERDAAKARADGVAYKIEAEAKANAKRITLIADAESKAIKKKAVALKNNPAMIDYMRAEKWNGNYPTTMMGNNPNILMQLK